jgi:hypothetical protein
MPKYIAFGDLNQDGAVDLVVSSWIISKDKTGEIPQSQVLVFYQKNGTYSNSPDRIFPVKFRPWGLVIGDFDADGKNDFAAAGYRRELYLFLSSEKFSITHANWNINHYGHIISTAHLTKNTKMDFMVGPTWRAWKGGDTFSKKYILDPGNKEWRPQPFSTIADVNLDGNPDIIFAGRASYQKNGIWIYYGPFIGGGRTIQSTEIADITMLCVPFPIHRVSVADMNHDGRPDIVAGGASQDNILIYYQNQPIGFTKDVGPSIAVSSVGGIFLTTDINSDGLCDLAATKYNQNSVSIFFQQKKSEFLKFKTVNTAIPDISLSILEEPIKCIASADINKDGYTDLAVISGKTILIFFINKEI